MGADEKEDRLGETGRGEAETGVEPVRFGLPQHRLDAWCRRVRAGRRRVQVHRRSGRRRVVRHRCRGVRIFR